MSRGSLGEGENPQTFEPLNRPTESAVRTLNDTSRRFQCVRHGNQYIAV